MTAAEYRALQEATRLRWARIAGESVEAADLDAAEDALAAAEQARRDAAKRDTTSGRLAVKTLGADSTGLEATVTLRMEYVPTAIAHLLSADDNPLVEVEVKNATETVRRVRASAFIDGLSATAVHTGELRPQERKSFLLAPVLRASALRDVTELTRAGLSVLVEDLDDHRVEFHQTFAIWLLARSTAPLAVLDPKTALWRDMTPYFGAFVTPNAPAVQEFLRKAAARHPGGSLLGYQGEKEGVESQVRAMFEALHADADIVYVNSVLTTSPREGFADQRVRVPRESLATRQANCIDGTVLYASLIEAASMSPAIVIVPGHAFVGWQTWEGSGTWAYLETTMTAAGDFAAARANAEETVLRYTERREVTCWPLVDLRTTHGIFPME